MKQSFIFLGSLCMTLLFAQCRTTRSAIDITNSSGGLTDSPIRICSYSHSNGMMAMRKQWTVVRVDDNKYKLSFSQFVANDPPKEFEIETDGQIEKDLHNIFREVKLHECKPKTKKDKPVISDAPVVFFSVSFMDRTEYSNQEPYDNSDEIWAAMNRADEYILDFIKKHRNQ